MSGKAYSAAATKLNKLYKDGIISERMSSTGSQHNDLLQLMMNWKG